jgi:hypothetical protein
MRCMRKPPMDLFGGKNTPPKRVGKLILVGKK